MTILATIGGKSYCFVSVGIILPIRAPAPLVLLHGENDRAIRLTVGYRSFAQSLRVECFWWDSKNP